jgi:hypothetical protein
VQSESQQHNAHVGRKLQRKVRAKTQGHGEKKRPHADGSKPQNPAYARHQHIVETFDDLAHSEGGFGARQPQGDAKDQSKQDHPDHVSVGGRAHGVVGHHADNELHRGLFPGAGGNPTTCFSTSAPQRLHPLPRTQGVDQNQANHHGNKGHEHGIDEGAHAKPAELPQFQPHDADDQR